MFISGFELYSRWVLLNNKRAICFATWLQNELNRDVARITTHEKWLQDRFERGW